MKKGKICFVILGLLFVTSIATAKKGPRIEPSYAWELLSPLGLHETATIDTALYNYFQLSIPSEHSIAFATTGHQGGAGLNMIYFDRKPMSDFYFRDVIEQWLPVQGNHKFYNTRIPMTLVSYNTAGGRQTSTDRLRAVFSGNANAKLQFGALIDFQYSKGCYTHQAAKNMVWGLSSSYMGDRYELQTFFNHYNGLTQNNGGITDDRYITDPAELQGGQSSIDEQSIPTRLTAASTRMKGQEFYMNHRYKVGFWEVTPPNDSVPDDTIEHRRYIPVSSFIWTMDYNDARHTFNNTSSSEAATFWDNNYLTTGNVSDPTSYRSIRNTLGVSLLEGFNKYAKAGLAAYLTHEYRTYRQVPDTLPIVEGRPELLTPYPYDSKIASRGSENFLWVGAQLTKQQGKILRYEATAKIGVAGRAAGELDLNGKLSTRFKLFGDSVTVGAYARFANESAPYLMNNFVSNYFIWHNDFGKIRRLRFGGRIEIPHTGTSINVGLENVQNHIYFNQAGMPVQHGGSVQVLSASLEQNFKLGILNWRNRVTYQTTSNDAVIPLPQLSVYSNLYLLFKIAKVLDVQFGVDCDYYTRYYAPEYQPATMAFCNQREIKVGNYPFMNVYANMKLKKARFYVMLSHFNQSFMSSRNYFSLPHYPLNPMRFQMGVSVDFAN